MFGVCKDKIERFVKSLRDFFILRSVIIIRICLKHKWNIFPNCKNSKGCSQLFWVGGAGFMVSGTVMSGVEG